MVLNPKPEAKPRRILRVLPRPKTLPPKLTKLERRAMRRDAALDDELLERPRTRGECLAAELNATNFGRPCPWVSCPHHLYLDVNSRTGSVKINFPDREPWELAETCALDVADSGSKTLEEVGNLLNLTRERVRQIEVRACLRVQRELPSVGIEKD